MDDYKTMYFILFNKISDALNQIEQQNYGEAESLLKLAQCCGEDYYLEEETEK